MAEIALTKRKAFTGWAALGMIPIVYFALYALNYSLPLGFSSYTTRIWLWTQIALTLTAVVVMFQKRSSLGVGAIGLGLVLGILSGLSHCLHNPSLRFGFLEGFSVLVCFVAGLTLFKERNKDFIPAFRPPLSKIGLSILFGVLLALPFAALNNLYFSLNAGGLQLQSAILSAFEAFSPAIHEEIIFRFFMLALCFRLIPPGASARMKMGSAIFLAVIPHSLNHLPDLFLQNPLMGLFMLVATCLLFGLPMALLQVKRNLEGAIAFHWFIDFMRFWFGF